MLNIITSLANKHRQVYEYMSCFITMFVVGDWLRSLTVLVPSTLPQHVVGSHDRSIETMNYKHDYIIHLN